MPTGIVTDTCPAPQCNLSEQDIEHPADAWRKAIIKENQAGFLSAQNQVRSEPAIYLQEAFVIFAANFIRLATHWVASQTQPTPQNLKIEKVGVKRQVQVGAHVSAQVIHDSEGKLLRFIEHSVFAGKDLKFPGCSSPKSFC